MIRYPMPLMLVLQAHPIDATIEVFGDIVDAYTMNRSVGMKLPFVLCMKEEQQKSC